MRRGTTFLQVYQCYPISVTGKHHLENGGKIILPASALNHLSSYPMLFKLINPTAQKISHCGVVEFNANEGMVFLPDWLMSNLNVQQGDFVTVKSAFLKKATFVRLRPHEMAFLEVSNHKAVLERTLGGFSCLTAGDTIVVEYNGRKFCVDVLDTKPDNKAVRVIEADCQVDFAPALDHKEIEKPAVAVAVAVVVKRKERGREEKEKVKFSPFMGVGRRLDGRSSCGSESVKEASTSGGSTSVVQNDVVKGFNYCDNGATCSRRKVGKLVFGSSGEVKNSKKVKEDKKKSKIKEEEKSFQPFSGKSFKLSDSLLEASFDLLTLRN